MGMLVMGSTIRPLMFISIITSPRFSTFTVVARRSGSLAPDAVGARAPDRHVDELPQPLRRSWKVDHRVAAGAARQLPLAPPAGRVDQHLVRRSNRPLEEVRLDRPLERLQRHDAPRLLCLRHVVRHPLRCQRVRPLRVLEREHAVVAAPRSVSDSVSSKSASVSPGKPTIISVDSCTFGIAARMRATRSRYSSRVCRRRISAEHARRAGLHGKMQMFTDLRQVADRGDDAVAGVARMRAREADAIDAGNFVDRFEQRREIARRIVRRLVVIHDLAEQLDFAPAAGGRLADVGEDLRLRRASARARGCTARRRTRRSRCSLR